MNKSYLKYVAKVEENMKKAQERLATTTADYEQGPCQDGYVQIGVKEKKCLLIKKILTSILSME